MKSILVFGDSIVAGRGVTKNESWVSNITRLTDKNDKNDILVYNLGVAGESSQELLERYETEIKARCRRRSPDDDFLIIIAIGINDSKGIGSVSNFNTPLKTFIRNINALTRLTKRYSNNLIFVGLATVDESKTVSLGDVYFVKKNIRKYNNSLKNICKKLNIAFVEIFEEWSEEDYGQFLIDDGIHLSKFGHRRVSEKLKPAVTAFMERRFDPFQVLKKEYSLSGEDIKAIKERFIESKILKSDLVLGQFFDKKPVLIIGAPCIRKDIEGISLNSFYQIFLPIKVASILHLPCKIFLGVKEEIIFQPKLFDNYKKIGAQLENGIKKIAEELRVKIEVVNTNSLRYDSLINKCVEDLKVRLTTLDSTYLFNLSLKKSPKPLHSTLRIISNQRVITCNNSYTLNKLFGEYNYLIVEDAEQYTCVLFARKFDKGKSPNFLAFLPLPNISGTGSMFRSEKEERLLLGKHKNYYRSVFKKFPPWVLTVYREVFRLVDGENVDFNRDFESFLKGIKKASNYFYG